MVAEAVAEDIAETKHLTWRSMELYQVARKDSTKSSAWEIALACVKEDGGCKPGNTSKKSFAIILITLMRFLKERRFELLTHR